MLLDSSFCKNAEPAHNMPGVRFALCRHKPAVHVQAYNQHLAHNNVGCGPVPDVSSQADTVCKSQVCIMTPVMQASLCYYVPLWNKPFSIAV